MDFLIESRLLVFYCLMGHQKCRGEKERMRSGKEQMMGRIHGCVDSREPG